jgi:hypothetical protein
MNENGCKEESKDCKERREKIDPILKEVIFF